MPVMGGVAKRPYVALLAALFAIVWLGLAINPRYGRLGARERPHHPRGCPARADPTACPALDAVVLADLLFLTLHAVGAHYTYSEVPYDAWFTALTGKSLNQTLGWQRNNFDRMVHFLYGLLLTQPVREGLVYATGLRGFWGYFLPMDLTMSSSATYELIEWGAATVFGGDLGVAYVGAQGDVWDAQKTCHWRPWARSSRPPPPRPVTGFGPRGTSGCENPHLPSRILHGSQHIAGRLLDLWAALSRAPLDPDNWVLASILPLTFVGGLVSAGGRSPCRPSRTHSLPDSLPCTPGPPLYLLAGAPRSVAPDHIRARAQ